MEPHARARASRVSSAAVDRPGETIQVAVTTRPAIPATFQMAGAAYGRKKRRCVFSIPRDQAEMIMKPDIRKNSRVSETGSARDSPLQPPPQIVGRAPAD